MKYLLPYIQYLLITFLILEVYTLFDFGYFKEYLFFKNSSIELLTILFIYTIFFIILRAKKLLFIPIGFVLSFITIDSVTNTYNRYLDFSDLNNIPLLFDALLQSKGQIIYLFLVIPIIFVYFFLISSTFKKYILSFIIIIFFFIIPSPIQSLVSKYYIDIYNHMAYSKKEFWSPKVNIDYSQTGRLSTFFYAGMKKQSMKDNIMYYTGNRKKELSKIIKQISPHILKRNVYLIGLESFSLPAQLTKLKLNYQNNDSMKIYDIINNASVMTTSIFGGGTIQSEFEALCGVPALQKVSAFEFTEFTGAKTNCLPTILQELGYSTIVSNTYKPQPSFEALTSVGFKDINFPKEYFPNLPSYITNKNKAKGEYAIFDSDFFDQNQNYIDEKYLFTHKPIFNYMFSVWGHAFHEMTASNRPVAIKIDNAEKLRTSIHTYNAINQEYYRIDALQNYFDDIKLTDPTALVIAYSDHRPVLDGVDSYVKYGLNTDVFHNYIIIMDKGKYIKFKKTFPLYALPDIILNSLTDNWYCKQHKCKTISENKENYLEEYYKIMANAMSKKDKSKHFYMKAGVKYLFNNPFIPFIHFSDAESNYRWTNNSKAIIKFKIKEKKVFTGILKINIGTLGEQSIKILLNDTPLFNQKVNAKNRTLILNFNKILLKEDKINKLVFILPDACRPSNKDERILAMQFKSLILMKEK